MLVSHEKDLESATEPDPFDLPEEFLRSRSDAKWNLYGPDVLPAFVAEMDFAIAEPIQRAVRQVVEREDYGYPMRAGSRADLVVAKAFLNRVEKKFGWTPEPGHVQVVTDLVQGCMAAILAFSDPGDSVVLQVPCYPPFREVVATPGRRLLPLTMTDKGLRFGFDLNEIAAVADERTKILLLCNPHNPTGRVFTREELRELAEFAVDRDMVIVSDEIHADLIYPGRHHIPVASLGPDVAARTITLYSATKSFNIPGLRCGVMHFGSAALHERFLRRVPLRVLGSINAIGIDATVAAWEEGDAWLHAALRHLQLMRARLTETIAAQLPEIRCHLPEATYLAWLDCSALRLPSSAFQFFLDEAKVGFSPGETFDPECKHFVRFNFATSAPILGQILDRVVDAVQKARR